MDNDADINMDTDLMNELTCGDILTESLSTTLFGSVPDSCADDVQLTLETGDDLPDISTLEQFMDLTEFFVSSAVLFYRYFILLHQGFASIMWFTWWLDYLYGCICINCFQD